VENRGNNKPGYEAVGLPEEIRDRNAGGSQYRWTILGNSHLKLYLYRFTGHGWSTGTDYPKWFISAGLAKWYGEGTAKALEAFPDGDAWMLLIGKPSQGRKNGPCD
jgi:hypothetical protein